MKFTTETKINKVIVNYFDDNMICELAKRKEEGQYSAPFDVPAITSTLYSYLLSGTF